MKRLFQVIGLIGLLAFSFFLTDKTAIVVKNMDEVMQKIKKNKNLYETKGEDAIIINDGIIPGISKKIVNVNKSYNNMKEYGKYNDKLYVYDYVLPHISVKENLDKYIIMGNSSKKMVSFNFLIEDDFSILLRILKINNIKANFFVNDFWLQNNLDITYNLINEGYIFGINNSKDNNYEWMNTIITKVGKQKQIFCYQNVKKCKSINGYTIKGSFIDNNYYSNLKKELKSGAIITFKADKQLINNLDYMIKYVLKKGYTISNLFEHIKE